MGWTSCRERSLLYSLMTFLSDARCTVLASSNGLDLGNFDWSVESDIVGTVGKQCFELAVRQVTLASAVRALQLSAKYCTHLSAPAPGLAAIDRYYYAAL